MMKKILSVLIVAIIAFYVVGCNKTETVELSSMRVPSKVEKKLNNDLKINATVGFPKKLFKDIYRYDSNYKSFDIEKIAMDLFPNGKISDSDESNFDVISHYYDNYGHELYSDNSKTITYTNGKGEKIKNAFRDFNGIVGDGRDTFYNLSAFKNKKDFSFKSCKKALKEIKSLLKKWNINYYDDVSVYKLDYKTLEKEYKKIYPKLNSDEKVDYNWSENDNCYYFKFQQQIDNIPVSQADHGNADDGSGATGGHFEFIYNKDGISYINISSLYKENTKTKIKGIVSLDDAIKTVKNKYDNIFITEPIVINKIDFCYVANTSKKNLVENSDDDNYELIPCWVFTYHYNDDVDGDSNVQYDIIIVNAENGEEIE